MNLNWSQTRALRQLLELFSRIGKDQKSIAESAGGDFDAADISRAKSGYVSQKKWPLILNALKAQARTHPAQEHKEIVEDICAIIEKKLNISNHAVGIDDSDFTGYPDLQLAAVARNANQQLNPSIWNLSPPESVYTVQITYPEKPIASDGNFLIELIGKDWKLQFDAINRLQEAMDHFQKQMRGALVDANRRGRQCSVLPLKVKDKFRGLLSAARIQTTPLIYLIPFFLTADRRFNYGVVKYANHRSLGVLLSRVTLKGILPTDPDRIGRDDFVKLISNGLRVCHIDPYSAEHILCQMLIEFDDERILAKFNEVNLPPEADIESAISLISESPSDTMLVFELADLFVISEQVRAKKQHLTDSKIIRLDHGVGIDVGVGFSLRAFDWVVEGDRFKSIHQNATKLISGYREDLKTIGIELDTEPK